MSIVIEPRDYDDPDVVRLITAVQQEYVERYGGPDESPVDAVDFAPPRGRFVVALLDGVPVATGAWRLIDDQCAEIKRMYVVAAARRNGVARAVLADLEASAAAAGARRMVLNTGTQQPEAITLYESAGYEPAEAYGRYACAPMARFYGKGLARPQANPAPTV